MEESQRAYALSSLLLTGWAAVQVVAFYCQLAMFEHGQDFFRVRPDWSNFGGVLIVVSATLSRSGERFHA
jgi:hypothetical protein